jgi:hypothetical protein
MEASAAVAVATMITATLAQQNNIVVPDALGREAYTITRQRGGFVVRDPLGRELLTTAPGTKPEAAFFALKCVGRAGIAPCRNNA